MWNVQIISNHRLRDACITWLWRRHVFEYYLIASNLAQLIIKANSAVPGLYSRVGSKSPVSLGLADISKPKCASHCAYLLILLSTSLSLHTCLRAPPPRTYRPMPSANPPSSPLSLRPTLPAPATPALPLSNSLRILLSTHLILPLFSTTL